MPSRDRLSQETDRILRIINQTSFEDCLLLERNYKNLSFGTGIYAIRSADDILYVGQANAFRTRFQSGHQALLKMLVDGLPPLSLRILTIALSSRYADRMLEIEKRIIFALRPQYNVRIPTLDEVSGMQLREPTTGHLKEVLNYLPDPVVDALEDHADTYGLTDAQVIELAIANLLDLNTTSLGDLRQLETLAQLKEQVAILQTQLQAAQAQGFTVPELPE